jgi:hypothetical protein
MPSFPNKVSIRKVYLKKVGIIDLDGFYKVMYKWFYDNGYVFEEPTSRIRPGTAAGVEYEYKWACWRKVNEYVKYHITVWIYVWDAKKMDVIKEGQKIELTKCRLEMEFDGYVELDWTKRFNTKFEKFLFWFYNQLILRPEKLISNYWDELYYRVYKLQTIAKEYLDMESKGNAYYDVW